MEENSRPKPEMDLDAIRAELAGKTGVRYWRSLEEISDQPAFQKFVDDEFPNRESLANLDRRSLLKYMGASFALAGLAGCRSVFLPEDKVVPYVRQPEELLLGKPLFYATAIPRGATSTGVLVEQHEGRPIQIMGNELHRSSLGAADSMTQAEILALYDPDRSANVLNEGDVSTWELFLARIREVLRASNGGQGVSILTGAIGSPVVREQIDAFLAAYPQARWFAYEPVGRGNLYPAMRAAFGRAAEPVYDFSRATTIVSLGGDFLSASDTPGSLAYARQYASTRRVKGKTGTMSRLYAFETTPGLVGTMADHRWPVGPAELETVARALLGFIGTGEVPAGKLPGGLTGPHLAAMATDLRNAGTAGVVVPGEFTSPATIAIAHAINAELGAVGTTVRYIAPLDLAEGRPGIEDLAASIADKSTRTLVMLDTNPAYTAGNLGFDDLIKEVPLTVHLGRMIDETALLSTWHIPQTHPLEEWGDGRSHDGQTTLVQPLLAPLFQGRSVLELLGHLNLGAGRTVSAYDMVRRSFRNRLTGDFEKSWRRLVHDGCVPNETADALVLPAASLDGLPTAVKPKTGLTAVFRPDQAIYDGRYANNGWLQELPRPLTKLTWDNVALMSPATAKANGVGQDDWVELEMNGVTRRAVVHLAPGHAANVVTLHLGFGRRAGGAVASILTADGKVRDREREGGGFDAFAMKPRDGAWDAPGLILRRAGDGALACTQGHSPLGGDRIEDQRDVIREATLAAYLEKGVEALRPEFAFPEEEIAKNNLYVEEVFEWNGNKWAMTIDMNLCVGCNACVTACQSENNISVVGKEQVMRSREMHWLRIDRYYSGTDENPQVSWQPVACVQCEKAPCEPVCPVAATVHSHEGLNQMIYNRCVGTRYCSNNCPYKVRRFNYLNYSDNQPNFSDKIGEPPLPKAFGGPIKSPRGQGMEMLKMVNNPNVTVRGRGVMEKCTYCVQRINDARQEAKKQGREVKDGEIITACQQACPTETIVFGDMADKTSRVSQWRSDPRSYLLLEELQTRPRTSHLARLRNPNPEIGQPVSVTPDKFSRRYEVPR